MENRQEGGYITIKSIKGFGNPNIKQIVEEVVHQLDELLKKGTTPKLDRLIADFLDNYHKGSGKLFCKDIGYFLNAKKLPNRALKEEIASKVSILVDIYRKNFKLSHRLKSKEFKNVDSLLEYLEKEDIRFLDDVNILMILKDVVKSEEDLKKFLDFILDNNVLDARHYSQIVKKVKDFDTLIDITGRILSSRISYISPGIAIEIMKKFGVEKFLEFAREFLDLKIQFNNFALARFLKGISHEVFVNEGEVDEENVLKLFDYIASRFDLDNLVIDKGIIKALGAKCIDAGLNPKYKNKEFYDCKMKLIKLMFKAFKERGYIIKELPDRAKQLIKVDKD